MRESGPAPQDFLERVRSFFTEVLPQRPHYEERPQQQQLGLAVARALARVRLHNQVEAIMPWHEQDEWRWAALFLLPDINGLKPEQLRALQPVTRRLVKVRLNLNGGTREA